MQIHGIVVTRNDWGHLTMAIANALHHVDVVHVLNHGSTDQTAAGLKVLSHLWGDRLVVHATSAAIPFDQAVLTNMIAAFAEAKGADWIYVFDSDEFLALEPPVSLRGELSALAADVVAVRYGLTNYIVPADFNRFNVDHYTRLVYRSNPTAPYDPALAWASIAEGRSTFFDVPFPPKLIFRARSGLLINGGAHMLRWKLTGQNTVISTALHCAHLSLISRATLERKSAHGAYVIEQGMPRHLNWQLQMIHQLDREGRLDWFWRRHSINATGDPTENPSHVIDPSLVRALGPVIEHFKAAWGGADLEQGPEGALASGAQPPTTLPLDDAFRLSEFFDHKQRLLMKKMR